METETITFRTSPEGKKRIVKEAGDAGLPVDDYIRWRLETGGYRDIRGLNEMVYVSERLFAMEKQAFEEGSAKLGLDIQQTVILLNHILKTIYESEDFQKLQRRSVQGTGLLRDVEG